MRKFSRFIKAVLVCNVILGIGAAGSSLYAGDVAQGTPALGSLIGGAPFYAIAIVMGVACLSAAYAVGKVGSAALGAAAEKPELLGKAIVFVGLGEGIAIFGLIISLMLLNVVSKSINPEEADHKPATEEVAN